VTCDYNNNRHEEGSRTCETSGLLEVTLLGADEGVEFEGGGATGGEA